MKFNWRIRFRNRVWLTTLLAVVCTFVFDLLQLFGVQTNVEQEQILQAGAAILSLLSALGVVMDPTTPGVSDALAQGGDTLAQGCDSLSQEGNHAKAS